MTGEAKAEAGSEYVMTRGAKAEAGGGDTDLGVNM